MKLSGGCLCGAIRYEASVPDSENWYCHCRMCQRWTGSVVAASAIIPQTALRYTRGEPGYYRSSGFAERGFCRGCGSPLVFRPIKDDWVAVQAGTLDDPGLVPPEGHFGIESRVGWLEINEGLPGKRTEDDDWFRSRSGERAGRHHARGDQDR